MYHLGLMGFDHVTNPYLYPDIHPEMIPQLFLN